LKETRPLWPPQRGVGLREPNLGKTNPRVTLFICLRFVFHPLSRTRFFITNANPTCSCVYICKFQFRPIHPPPSRRLSGGESAATAAVSVSMVVWRVVVRKGKTRTQRKNRYIKMNHTMLCMSDNGGFFSISPI
jgi:hypothetical protein